jgi:hypothetical protein
MCYYRNKINVRVWNLCFFIANFVTFSAWNYGAYLYTNWLKYGWMTFGNISPMTFTIIILLPIFNERVREYAMSSIAFLNFGMFIAMLISPEYDYIFNFKTEATFMYATEAVCHLICSLFGIYLVFSKQIKADFEHWWKGLTFTLSLITVGVICNFVYHRDYFGMNPYGNAKIYMIDLFSGFWPTVIAYYFGIAIVMTVGLQIVYLLEKATAKFFEHEHAESHSKDAEPSVDTEPAEDSPTESPSVPEAVTCPEATEEN